MINEVELLEWLVDRPKLAGDVKQALGLDRRADPLNVPLEPLDWRTGKVQINAPDSPAVEAEFDIVVVKLPHAAVYIDSNGHRVLARAGDLLIRNEDGAYSLVKRGVRRAG